VGEDLAQKKTLSVPGIDANPNMSKLASSLNVLVWKSGFSINAPMELEYLPGTQSVHAVRVFVLVVYFPNRQL